MADEVKTANSEEVKPAETPQVPPETPASEEAKKEVQPESKQLTPEEIAEKEKNRVAAEERIAKREAIKKKQAEEERFRQLEIENARLKGMLEATGNLPEKKESSTEQFPEAEPERSNFETDNEWLRSHEEWAFKRREWMETQKTQKQQREESEKSRREKVSAQHDKGLTEYEDFDEVTQRVPNLRNQALDYLFDSEIGHKVAYYLGQNPEEGKRIAALSESKQIAEIARLEDKIKAGVITKPKTNAPEPPPTVRAGSVKSDDSVYMSDTISPAERIRISQERKAAEAARR